MTPIVNILNTVAASAADLVIGTGTISVGPSGSPVIRFINILKSSKNVYGLANIVRSKYEQSQSTAISFTAANSTEYAFIITQVVNDQTVSVPIRYTSDASATAGEIASALVSLINGSSKLRVTASGSGTPITIVADAVSNGGSAVFSVTVISNVTQAPTAGSLTISSISNPLSGPREITFGSSHGLFTGQTININGLTATGGYLDVEDKDLQIQVINATTAYLVGTSGTGAITVGSATYSLPGQNPFGQYADVSASLSLAGSSSSASSGFSYSKLTLAYASSTSSLLDIERDQVQGYELWIKEADLSSSTASVPSADYLALEAALQLTLAGKTTTTSFKSNIVATATSTTTDFGSLRVGDVVIVSPVPAGTPANTTGSYFGTVATIGTLPFAAVVGSNYAVFGSVEVADSRLIAAPIA